VTVSVTFGNQANAMIARRRLSFRPSLTETGEVIWTCGYPPDAGNTDREIGPNLTDVKPQFLPSECRWGSEQIQIFGSLRKVTITIARGTPKRRTA